MCYLAVSCFLVSYFSILGYKKFQNDGKEKASRKELDEFYLEKLKIKHLTISFCEKKGLYLAINGERDGLKETKEHMSKDGYNWQQIANMNNEAKEKAKENIRNRDEGYEDGLAGKPKNPDKVWSSYNYGYAEGEKTRLNK